MSNEAIDAGGLPPGGPLVRLAALKDAIALFPVSDLPPASDLIAYADWIATGMVDVAQGNDRVAAQNYENRWQRD